MKQQNKKERKRLNVAVDEEDAYLEKSSLKLRSRLHTSSTILWMRKRFGDSANKRYLFYPNELKRHMEILRIFKIFDEDESNKLDLKEFLEMMNDANINIDQEKLQKIYDIVDRDHDNALSFKEFKECTLSNETNLMFTEIMKKIRHDESASKADPDGKKPFLPLSFPSMLTYLTHKTKRDRLMKFVEDNKNLSKDKIVKLIELLRLYSTRESKLDSQGMFEEIRMQGKKNYTEKAMDSEHNFLPPVDEKNDSSDSGSAHSSVYIEGPENVILTNSRFNAEGISAPKVKISDAELENEVQKIVRDSKKEALKEINSALWEKTLTLSGDYQNRPLTTKAMTSYSGFNNSMKHQRFFSNTPDPIIRPGSFRTNDPLLTQRSLKTPDVMKTDKSLDLNTHTDANSRDAVSNELLSPSLEKRKQINSKFAASHLRVQSLQNNPINRKLHFQTDRLKTVVTANDGESYRSKELNTLFPSIHSPSRQGLQVQGPNEHKSKSNNELKGIILGRKNNGAMNLNAIEEGETTLKNTEGLTMKSPQQTDPVLTHVPVELVMTLATHSQDNQDVHSQQEILSAKYTRTRFNFIHQPRDLNTPISLRTSPRFILREDTAANTHPDGFQLESSETNSSRLFNELFKTGFEYEKKQANKINRPARYSHARDASGVNQGMYYTSKKSITTTARRKMPREIGEVIEVPVKHSLAARKLFQRNNAEAAQSIQGKTQSSFRKTPTLNHFHD